MKEVELLQGRRHAHLVQVIGTYTIGPRELSLLIYPVAEYNLDEFMTTIHDEIDAYISPGSYAAVGWRGVQLKRDSLLHFFSCIASAINFIHSIPIKHMDLKPSNILVKAQFSKIPEITDEEAFDYVESYEVYLADFGISRVYESASSANTDGKTMFTRKYAAPEVINGEIRGLPADIFSLGCIFAEMHAVLDRGDRIDLETILNADETSDGTYGRSCSEVQTWLHSHELEISGTITHNWGERNFAASYALRPLTSKMLSPEVLDRPIAVDVFNATCASDLPCIHSQPEEMEAARHGLNLRTSIPEEGMQDQEDLSYESKADSIRGAAAIVRSAPFVPRARHVEELEKLRDERMTPISEDNDVEWDGIRRRRTITEDDFKPGSSRRQFSFQNVFNRPRNPPKPETEEDKITRLLSESGFL